MGQQTRLHGHRGPDCGKLRADDVLWLLLLSCPDDGISVSGE